MRYKLTYTEEAREDIHGIKLYISRELGNPAAAKRTVSRIMQTLDILHHHPLAVPSLQSLTGYATDLRMLICGQHIALYRVEGGTVCVARVIAARQDYIRVLFGELM